MKIIEVRTPVKETFIDLTAQIKVAVVESGVKSGMCFVSTPHTTAAITINENTDPAVADDILMTMRSIVPGSLPYTHLEGNSPAHCKASLIGSSVWIPIAEGRPALGIWQGVFFCEFDGPRKRKAVIQVISSE